MDLYEVKARGIRGPLNSREISHLFRVGHLHRRVPCKAKNEATWCTIGEFFPLLEYGIGSYILPPDNSAAATRRLPLRRLSLLLLALAVLGAFYLYHQPPSDSAAAPVPLRDSRTGGSTVLALNN